MVLTTLKKRAQFLRVRGGRRYSTPAFLLECKRRPAGESLSGTSSPAQFGFTVTKKLGGAVVRNRIRRRLKAAIERAAVPLAQPDTDYVVLARRAALDRPFASLLEDAERAMRSVRKVEKRRRATQNRVQT